MAKEKVEATANTADSKLDKKSRVSQSDIPSYSLTEALRIPRAIVENYAGDPTKPLDVAAALDMSPSSGGFRGMTGAAIAYGLVEGGYNASQISCTPLSKRILSPLEEGEEETAKREALLKPRIIGEFLRKYDGKPIPKDDIALNVVSSFGVPRDRAHDIFSMITTEADKLGLITDIKGKQYVNLGGTHGITSTVEHIELEKSRDSAESEDLEEATARTPAPLKVHPAARRVFITHGKNKDFIEPIKKLLSFGELEAVVSVESQSVSQPVPEKVMAEMRSCSAAIIHVAAEQVLIDKEANEHVVLNPNVLIEIGAAMALYGRRFILLVKSGVKMPSNLQGLFEVRYTSEPLDGDATIRLMEAINALKATQILEA